MTLNRKELCAMVGREIDSRRLQGDLFDLGLETEEQNGDDITLDVTADRPDLLSVEGIARLLRYHYGLETKVRVPEVQKSEFTCVVDPSMRGIRPYITCAIVKDIRVTDGLIKSLMQVQEKLHGTFGRNRRKGAIGIHDLDKLSGTSITYRAVKPEGDTFVPLGKTERMTLGGALREHEKGRQYGHIVDGKGALPAIYDAAGIFSFPPIINSARTEVTTSTRNLLVELTGEDRGTIERMLNILLYMLSDRGGKVHSLRVRSGSATEIEPSLKTEKLGITPEYVNSVLGTEFTAAQIRSLLAKSGFGGGQGGKSITVTVPPYRADVLHAKDVVDDIGRAYGFNNLTPSYPATPTIGELTRTTKLTGAVRDVLVGEGFQDLLNFMLTDKDSNYGRMGIGDDGTAVEIENPYSEQYTIVRTWLLPSLMQVLSNNRTRQYPQNLSEVGQAMLLDGKIDLGCATAWKAAAAMCGMDAQYNTMKSELQNLARAFGAELETVPLKHPSFITGRCASVLINGKAAGFIGEISPKVLRSWGIEMPVAAFEIGVDALAPG